MADDKGGAEHGAIVQKASKFLGSLKDALAAAGRDDTAERRIQALAQPGPAQPHAPPPLPAPAPAIAMPPPTPDPEEAKEMMRKDATHGLSAAEAAREVRGQMTLKPGDRHMEMDAPPTTRVVRAAKQEGSAPARTQLVRGRQPVKRGAFHQDPVVGWLVVVGGPGLGSYRPVYEGNNTIGRSVSQRIPLDFGDETISSEEQAYIRYDSSERSFLFVPNLAKTNVVSVNAKRPTAAVELVAMDVITVGRTQLVFVPFCGPDFDWSEIAETKD